MNWKERLSKKIKSNLDSGYAPGFDLGIAIAIIVLIIAWLTDSLH